MDDIKNLVKITEPKDIQEFVQDKTTDIVALISGTISDVVEPSKAVLMAGRLVQAGIRFEFLTQLKHEIQELVKSGKVKARFESTRSKLSFVELMKFIDDPNIADNEVFDAAKALFFSVIAITADEIEEHKSYQLLQICKELKSSHILIIRACYAIYLQDDARLSTLHSYDEWQREIAEHTGLYEGIISYDEKLLVERGILSSRQLTDLSGITRGRNFRLSALGMDLCQRIENFSSI